MINQIKKILNQRKISCEVKLIKIKDLIELDVTNNYGFNKLVKLADRELEKLNEGYGNQVTKIMIENLDSYIYKTGKDYANHYLVILKWIKKDDTIKPITKREVKEYKIEF